MGSPNPCGGLLCWGFTPQGSIRAGISSPKLRFANIPPLILFFWDTNLLSGFLTSLISSLGSQEPAKDCAQRWGFFCNIVGKLLLIYEMSQKGASNMAHSSSSTSFFYLFIIFFFLIIEGMVAKGKKKNNKKPLLCSKAGEMFKHPKLRVKLVQNMVICCRVWISATASLSQGRSERESAGPGSENSE